MGEAVGIVGAGAWGTALACLLREHGHAVTLWVHSPQVLTALRTKRENDAYLPGVVLPDTVTVTGTLADAVRGQRALVVVTPSHVLRGVITRAAPFIKPGALIICAAKGLEIGTNRRLSQVLVEVLPPALHGRIVALSGPSFAREVAQGTPTAVTAAAQEIRVAREAQALLATPTFRVYTTSDVAGVELGGAVKNVIALAVGICEGLGLGTNAQAALMTRGLSEMTRLAVALGAHPLTLAGLSGLGDLVLTATGPLSRNRTVGIHLGHGRPLATILREMTAVAEGVNTCVAVRALAQEYGVSMPITDQVYAILYEAKPPAEAVHDLMARVLREERD